MSLNRVCGSHGCVSLHAWYWKISVRCSLEEDLRAGAYFLCPGGSPLQYSVLQESGIAGFAPGPSHNSGPKRCRMHTQGNGPGGKHGLGLLGRGGSAGLGRLTGQSCGELPFEPCSQSPSLLIPNPSRTDPVLSSLQCPSIPASVIAATISTPLPLTWP